MFQLLEFCDTISYCDLILSSEFRAIRSRNIKDMREERVISGEFWTDLVILYSVGFSVPGPLGHGIVVILLTGPA